MNEDELLRNLQSMLSGDMRSGQDFVDGLQGIRSDTAFGFDPSSSNAAGTGATSGPEQQQQPAAEPAPDGDPDRIYSAEDDRDHLLRAMRQAMAAVDKAEANRIMRLALDTRPFKPEIYDAVIVGEENPSPADGGQQTAGASSSDAGPAPRQQTEAEAMRAAQQARSDRLSGKR